jgi:hypothetical protein
VEFAAKLEPEDCVGAFFEARYHDAVGFRFGLTENTVIAA